MTDSTTTNTTDNMVIRQWVWDFHRHYVVKKYVDHDSERIREFDLYLYPPHNEPLQYNLWYLYTTIRKVVGSPNKKCLFTLSVKGNEICKQLYPCFTFENALANVVYSVPFYKIFGGTVHKMTFKIEEQD